jgi:hypothetical protein
VRVWPSGVVLIAPLIAVVLLVFASAGHAAMWLRITVDPARPLAGDPAHVTVVTLVNSSSCVTDPTADARPWSDWNGDGGKDLRFELKAFQADRSIDIPLTRRANDPAYWDGTVSFPAAGEWTVRMVYPEWSRGAAAGEECAGARTTVAVRPSSSVLGTSTDVPVALVVAIAAIALALGCIVLLRVRRTGPKHDRGVSP